MQESEQEVWAEDKNLPTFRFVRRCPDCYWNDQCPNIPDLISDINNIPQISLPAISAGCHPRPGGPWYDARKWIHPVFSCPGFQGLRLDDFRQIDLDPVSQLLDFTA